MTLRILVLLAALVAPAVAITGREVIDQAQQKNGFSTWKDRKGGATMDTYDHGTLTRTRDMNIIEQTDPRGEHRTFLVFTSPSDVQGTRFLHLSPRGDQDQQWLWTPQTRRTRRLGDAQRDENFFGTDLSYRDLEMLVRIQQWNDDEATATLVGEETVDGHPSYVVELKPKNDEFAYTKYKLWFGKDDLLLWRLDVYEDDQTVLKRIEPTDYQKIGNYQTAMRAKVSNVTADTRTDFKMRDVKYDTGVSDAQFSISALDK
jgi:outer membrane lipoprotein-sorting protein